MGLPIFFIFGILLNLAHSREIQEPRDLVIDQTVTGIVGEDVYLHCVYTGQSKISFSSWNRLDSSNRAKKMAGYKYGKIPFSKDSFGTPVSVTNLTVRMSITGFEVEGEYTCVFNSDEDETKETMFLSVIARPDVDIAVKKEVVNETLHQAVTCAASNAKPEASIRWKISGALPRDDIFSVNMMSFLHPNGTTSSTGVLRFPLVMNNESTVTCVVEHSAFAEPKEVNIEVDTFVSPLTTMETVLVQEGGEDFQEVICKAAGGRPHPNITWMLPEPKLMQALQRNISRSSDTVISLYRFPSDLYEGQNITCIFEYKLLPFMSTRTVTLPTYYLSSLELKDHRVSDNNGTSLAFQMEDTGITIRMEILGNYPSYKISCVKDGQQLPEDVNIVGSNLFIKGPLQLHHAGEYVCQASYRKHSASLQFTVEAKPKVLLPVSFPPNISMNLIEYSDHIYIECVALNSSPAANVSWNLPCGLNNTVQTDVTSCNGSHSVRSVLTVPICMPTECTIECVVEHPLTGTEGRQVSLPVCAKPNITLLSSIKWQNDTAYAWLVCSVESQRLPVIISWGTENCDIGIVMSHSESQRSHLVNVESVAHIPIYLYGGCTVTCVVEHLGLEKPEKRSFDIPSSGLSASRLFLWENPQAEQWHAICEYIGDGVKPNISWILPEADTIDQPTIRSTYNGINVHVNSSIEFQLSQYEGKDLICVIQNRHGKDGRQIIHVPKYYISSLEVLNKTTHNRRTSGHHEHRVTLEENLSFQKILLKAHGNAPSYKTQCYRTRKKIFRRIVAQQRQPFTAIDTKGDISKNVGTVLSAIHFYYVDSKPMQVNGCQEDGSAAQTVDMALVFTEPVSELDAGLYICHASYHHLTTTISIRVDVTSEETQHLIFVTTCFSSAAAITLILTVVLCVLCTPNGKRRQSNKKNRRERESLAALMQDPQSPTKTVLPCETGPDYAELVHYSIVLDVKSTV